MKQLICYILGFLFCWSTEAQDLDANNRLSVYLEDKTRIDVIGKALPMNSTGTMLGVNKASNEYYYLPTNIRLAKKPDGTPEFLFVKYTTERDASSGGVNGAILHFLVEWGLTPEQIKQAEAKLRQVVNQPKGGFLNSLPNARSGEVKLLGPVPLQSNDGTFEIISASLSDVKIMKSGKAPTVQGGKAVVAAKLDKNTAQLFAATLDKAKSIADLSMEMRFNYAAKIPAINGKIQVDWTRVKSYFDTLKYEKDKDGIFNTEVNVKSFSETYEKIVETGMVKVSVDLGGNTAAEQEAIQKINELFMASFANLIAANNQPPAAAPDASLTNDPSRDRLIPSSSAARDVKIDLRKVSHRAERKTETFTLNQRMNSLFSTTITGNLLGWYQQARDNKKCVYSVNLNDPFFEHRYINFILDLDAKDIFDNEVNYVSVKVRKTREQGNPFLDQIVIDKKYLSEKGSNVTMMYARGEDKNPDTYEYQTQWSLRGGNIFPPVPVWEKGDWAGVTLFPPVKPLNIEFEANLDQLKEMGISRATLQIRYKKFGEEIEDNLHVSPAQGQYLTNKLLFSDKDTRGYVYRLVFNHTVEGKLALPWSSKVNDNYVYATIPDELKDKTTPLFEAAKKLGAEIKLKEGKIPAAETILDAFKDIFNTIKK